MFGISNGSMGGMLSSPDAMSWIQPSQDLIKAIGDINRPTFISTIGLLNLTTHFNDVASMYEKDSYHYVEGTYLDDVGIVIGSSSDVFNDAKECVDSILKEYLEVLKEASQIAPYEFDIRFDSSNSATQAAIKVLDDAVLDLEQRSDNSKYTGRLKSIVEFIEYARCARSVKFTRTVGHSEKESVSTALADSVALAALFPNHATGPSQIEAQFVTSSTNYYAQRKDYRKHHPIERDRKYMPEDARATEIQSISHAFNARTSRFLNKSATKLIECSTPELRSPSEIKRDAYIERTVEEEAEALKSAICMSWALTRPSIYNAFNNINSRMQGAGAVLGGF
jgi:hypothetical protein